MADKISVVICGDGGCGKSSITLRLVKSQWIHEYDPTIEDSYSVTRTIDGIPYFLEVTDTAGQEEYRSVWAGTNLHSDAFLMVYDITAASTLPALDYYLEMIDMEADRRLEENQLLLYDERERVARLKDRGHDRNPYSDPIVGMPPPVKIIAGNKCDLKDSRVIPARQGLEYARRHGCGFMETSAWEVVNIEETFALIVRRVVEARRQHYQAQIDYTRPQRSRQSPIFTIGNTLSLTSPSERDTGTSDGPRHGEETPQQPQAGRRFPNWRRLSHHVSNRYSAASAPQERARSREEKNQDINRARGRPQAASSPEGHERHRWRRRLGCFS